MFGLSLADHLRLTFGHVIHSHRAHATTAARHRRWDRRLKAAEALLLLGTAVACAGLVYTLNPVHAMVAASLAGLGMVVLILRLAFDLERTAGAHRACSARLWHLREEYRAILADLKDEAISIEAARAQRDALMERLHRVYETAPPADRDAYLSAKRSLAVADEATLSDEEIDRFLPASLQKGSAAPSAPAPSEPPLPG